jgi:membrane-bound inhibitor of C-type lysozyme
VRRTRAALIAAFVAAPAFASAATPDPRETEPFIVSYRCDNGAVAVRYPAFQHAQREPIQLSFQGRRYAMRLERAASGARYVTRDQRLEWWTRGSDEGFLAVPGVTPPILANCKSY